MLDVLLVMQVLELNASKRQKLGFGVGLTYLDGVDDFGEGLLRVCQVGLDFLNLLFVA